MYIGFKTISYPEWVEKYGKELCEIYDAFIKETDTCPFEMSNLDLVEEMYRETNHYLFTDEIDCDVINIPVANGGQA